MQVYFRRNIATVFWDDLTFTKVVIRPGARDEDIVYLAREADESAKDKKVQIVRIEEDPVYVSAGVELE